VPRRRLTVVGQPVGQGGDQRVPPGAERPLEGPDGEQDAVAYNWLTDQLRVGQRRYLDPARAAGQDGQLERPAPASAKSDDGARAPSHEPADVVHPGEPTHGGRRPVG
jgi:hypothetical protein